MRRIFILMAVFAIATGAAAQLKLTPPNGYVGIGTNNPQERLQIGDIWTFHNGGTKFIGFNATYNNSSAYNVRIANGYSSLLKFDVNGSVILETAGYGLAGSQVITTGKNITLNASGNVGIGINPAYKLDVQGTLRFSPNADTWRAIKIDINSQWNVPQIYSNDFMVGNSNTPVNLMYVNWLHVTNKSTLASDEALKENIKPLNNMLNKLLDVEGKSYNYKKNTESDGIPELEELLEKETFGFIAQELERAFPELVDPPSAVNNYYSINYIGMIPVLVEAIKEQQLQIEFLQTQIDGCCKENPAYSPPRGPDENNGQEEDVETGSENSTKTTSINENNVSDVEKAKLFQNVPNPFSANTEIRFEIPENSNTAKLLIHDMQGAEIKSYTITAKGAGNIIVQAHELPAGMYMYTLLVNNTIIDTKKMILTK